MADLSWRDCGEAPCWTVLIMLENNGEPVGGVWYARHSTARYAAGKWYWELAHILDYPTTLVGVDTEEEAKAMLIADYRLDKS